MTRTLITSPPEVNHQGVKRWFIGDLEAGTQKVFMFDRPQELKAQNNDPRFMVRIFQADGKLVKQQFFIRHHALSRFLCRLFDVDIVELREQENLQQVA